MPQWLPLKKDDVLPLFVQQRPSSASLVVRLTRKWNSLHRLNRTFLIGITTLIVLGLVYVQLVSLPGQIEIIDEDTSNVSLGIEKGI